MHYNAFISYKHAEHDIKVAQTVQKELEHFHIPKKIKKKYGLKRIERIFRDKDELPITSDLSDEISLALENSDYLIVICSPASKQSVWVQREISFFLRNHSKHEILTVLAEGEPQDVIPEILLSDRRTFINDRGEEQVVNVSIEPLSCDYRGSIKHANKEELPRLASALIGCSYDELMNRRRQYKMRRTTVVFAGIMTAAIAFGGYLYYSKQKIHENYLDSLRNQSRYLANESQRVLDKEQRILSLQLALAALPDKKSERPVTAEAVRALTDASLAYVTINGTNIDSVWNYRMPNNISDFLVSPNGTSLAARDTGNYVMVWDINSHDTLIDISDSKTDIRGMMYYSDDTILIWGSEKLSAIDIRSSETLWTYTLDSTSFAIDEDAILTSDGRILFPLTNKKVLEISGSTGKKTALYIIPEETDGVMITPYDFTLSPDEKKLAFNSFANGLNHIVGVYDLETGKAVFSPEYDKSIRDISWAGDDRIMTAISGDLFSGSVRFSETSFLNQDHTTIECLDAKTLTKKWEHDLISTELILSSGFMPILQDNQVAYYCGNTAEIYDLDTGECYYSHNINSTIINMSDRDGDGWPLYITTDGKMANPYPSGGMNSVTMTTEFTDNLDKVSISNGVYVHQNRSRDIIYYGLYAADDEWAETDKNLSFDTTFDDYTLDDEALAIMTKVEDKRELTLIDPNENRVLIKVVSDDRYEFSNIYKLLGANDGYYYLIQSKDNGIVLTSINMKTGEAEDVFISDLSILPESIACYNDGKVIYVSQDSDNYMISMYDTKSGRTENYQINGDTVTIQSPPIYIPEASAIYYPGNNEELIIDTKTGKSVSVELPYGWEGTMYCAYDSSSDMYIITDTVSIAAIDKNGNNKYYFLCPGAAPLGLFCLGGETLVAYDNGSLYRYSAKNGNFISKNDLTNHSNGAYPAEFDYDKGSRTLYIQIGKVTDVIDTRNWYEVASINASFGHHVPTDHFLTFSYQDGGYHIGYFRHYTTAELIEKGKKMLGGFEMTDEEKSEYGIDQ